MTTFGIGDEELLAAVLDGSLPERLETGEPDVGEHVGKALARLDGAGRVDASTYLLGLEWAEMPFRRKRVMRDALEAFAGEVEGPGPRVLDFFDSAKRLEGVGSDHALDMAFEAWCQAHPSNVPVMLELAKVRDVDSSYLHALLLRQWHMAPQDALVSAIAWSRDARRDMRSQAIFVLGRFDYPTPADAEPAIVRFLELLPSSDLPDVRAAIMGACSLLLGRHGTEPRLLAALTSDDICQDAERRRCLLGRLMGHGQSQSAWLEKVVTGLVRRLSVLEENDVGLINRWLYDVDLDGSRETVLAVLSEIADNSEDGWTFRPLHAFSHRASQASPSLLEWYVTQWLLDGTRWVRDTLHELFSPLDEDIYPFSLSSIPLTEAETHFLARKVFAYLTYSHGPAVSLLSALIEQLKPSKRKALEAEIAELWLRNFPADIELFDAVARLRPKNGLTASVRRMREAVNAYLDPIKRLPANPALRPSAMERRFQTEIEHERSREIRDQADRHSIFGQLIKTSVLLHGRSSVSYIESSDGDPVRQVVPFQQIEHSVAIPVMDVIAPTKLLRLWHSFRNEPRPR